MTTAVPYGPIVNRPQKPLVLRLWVSLRGTTSNAQASWGQLILSIHIDFSVLNSDIHVDK